MDSPGKATLRNSKSRQERINRAEEAHPPDQAAGCESSTHGTAWGEEAEASNDDNTERRSKGARRTAEGRGVRENERGKQRRHKMRMRGHPKISPGEGVKRESTGNMTEVQKATKRRV